MGLLLRKDRKHHPLTESLPSPGFVLGLAIGVAGLIWVLMSAVHAIVLNEGSLVSQLVPPDFEEWLVRLLACGSIVALGAYACRLLEQQRRTQRKTERDRDLAASITQAAPMGLICLSSDGRVLEFNREMERLTGLEREAALGMDYAVLPLGNDARISMAAALARAHAGESTRAFETTLRDAAGEQRQICWNIDPLPGPDGKPVGAIAAGRDFTRRHEIQEALRQTAAVYRSIFDLAHDAVAVHDTETGALIDVNRAFCELFGYSRAEAHGMPLNRIMLPEKPFDLQTAMERLRRAVAGELQLFEWRAKKKSGEAFWAEVRLKKATIAGEPRIVAVVRDVTERMRTEEALRTREERYRLLVENQTDLVAKIDADGCFLFVSPSYCELFGRPAEDLLGRRFPHLAPEADRPTLRLTIAELRKPPHTSYVELRTLTQDGWRWLAWANKAILDDAGQVAAVVCVGRDITRQKVAERALRERDEKIRSLVEHSPDIIMNVDRAGRILFINRTVPGYTVEETIGRSLYDYVPPEQHEEYRRTLARVFDSGQPASLEVSGPGADGNMARYRTRLGPILGEGRVASVMLIASDVTELRRAQGAEVGEREESEERRTA